MIVIYSKDDNFTGIGLIAENVVTEHSAEHQKLLPYHSQNIIDSQYSTAIL